MNWLAHLYLTPQTPAGFLGALLGDVVRGSIPPELDPAVREAIALHRRIDAFSATHPAIRQSCRRIAATHGHYRRVLVDVFYDHVLARTWTDWADEPLAGFLGRVHAALDEVLAARPQDVPPFYPALRAQGWLASYADEAGIALTLRRMRARLRRDHPLEDAVRDLAAERDGFAGDFRSFFAEAIVVARGG